jgi:hypothetical protein
MNKPLKPNLIDPSITQKIVNTLRPHKSDYWGPAKDLLYSFYKKIIIPNIYIVLFIIFILLVLLFRYRNVQMEREDKEYDDNNKIKTVSTTQYNLNKHVEPIIDEAITMYENEKELSREPHIKQIDKRKWHDRYKWNRYRYKDIHHSSSNSESSESESEQSDSESSTQSTRPYYPGRMGIGMVKKKKY